MRTVGIMANGPVSHLPNLEEYNRKIDIWIGADLGALTLIEKDISVTYAVGDFDSITSEQKQLIIDQTEYFHAFEAEKAETDLELALRVAFDQQPEAIYLFGVTGGRLDHALINMQLLHTIVGKKVRGVIVDKWNEMELTTPGTYNVQKKDAYPYVSFIPFTERVNNLSLEGFYYPLENHSISWGSTRCISNEITERVGTFTYESGMLLLIQSCDDRTGE